MHSHDSRATLGILLDKDADEAHDDVDEEEPCLVPPDAVGQGQRFHEPPAHLQRVLKSSVTGICMSQEIL